MARKQSSADLQAQIAKQQEQLREVLRQEKLEAKQAEEKLALKIGRMVLDFQKNGFTGFTKSDFIKKVDEMVASSVAAPVPATAATAAEVEETPVADVLDSGAVELAAEPVNADTGNESGSDIAETSDTAASEDRIAKRGIWG